MCMNPVPMQHIPTWKLLACNFIGADIRLYQSEISAIYDQFMHEWFGFCLISLSCNQCC